MKKIDEVYVRNIKEKGFINNKSIFNTSLASISRLLVALAIFFIFALIANAQGDVTVQSGDVDVDGELNVMGDVGIGTPTPSESLEVIGNVKVRDNNEVFLNLQNTEASGKEYSIVSAGSASGIGVGKFAIYDGTDGLTRFIIDPTGNVGIGTINPNKELEVTGQIKSQNKITHYLTCSSGGASWRLFSDLPGVDGFAQIKIYRSYDYGNNDQAYQEAIYQRRFSNVNLKWRKVDPTNNEPVYLQVYDNSGTYEVWVIAQDYSTFIVEIVHTQIEIIENNPTTGTPVGTLLYDSSGDPNWEEYVGNLYTSGNMGIGTITPAKELHVKKTDTDSIMVVDSGDGVTPRYSALDFYDNGAPIWGLGKNPDGDFYIDLTGIGNAFNISRTDRKITALGDICTRVGGGEMCLSTVSGDSSLWSTGVGSDIYYDSGKVGIGTNSPDKSLHIKKQITSATAAERPLSIDIWNDNLVNLEVGAGSGILFKIPTLTSSAIGASIDAVKTSAADAETQTALVFSISQNDETLDEAMRIDQTGNVGIGTTNPGQKLVVHSSDSDITQKISTNAQDDARLWFTTDADNMAGGARFAWIALDHSEDILAFGNSGSLAEVHMAIADGGNVGIGTPTPFAKLEVSSVIKSTPTDSPGTCNADLEGGMYYDASLNEPCFCDGVDWKQFDGGGNC